MGKSGQKFEIDSDYQVKACADKAPNKPNSFVIFLRRVGATLSNMLFPAHIKCVICDHDLKTVGKYEICDDCMRLLQKIPDEHCCERCGAKLSGEERYCFNCQQDERYFDIARSCFVYDGEMRKLIHQLKFSNKPYLARALAPFLYDKLVSLGWKYDKIIPVPISKSRQKSRGYNQSLLLARELAKLMDTTVSCDVLIKTRETIDQVGLNYIERKKNLQGSFDVVNKYLVRGKDVLLIDDVMTTGATASSCANTLKKAGANRVFVLTVAHGVVKLPTIPPTNTLKLSKKHATDI